MTMTNPIRKISPMWISSLSEIPRFEFPKLEQNFSRIEQLSYNRLFKITILPMKSFQLNWCIKQPRMKKIFKRTWNWFCIHINFYYLELLWKPNTFLCELLILLLRNMRDNFEFKLSLLFLRNWRLTQICLRYWFGPSNYEKGVSNLFESARTLIIPSYAHQEQSAFLIQYCYSNSMSIQTLRLSANYLCLDIFCCRCHCV